MKEVDRTDKVLICGLNHTHTHTPTQHSQPWILHIFWQCMTFHFTSIDPRKSNVTMIAGSNDTHLVTWRITAVQLTT